MRASAPAAQQQQPAQYAQPAPAAPVEAAPKTAVEIAIDQLTGGGWTCAPLGTGAQWGYQCSMQAWPTVFLTSTDPSAQPCTPEGEICGAVLKFDSYDAARRFGKPCAKYQDAMADLAVAPMHFTVGCADNTGDNTTSQSFSFTVYELVRVGYAPDASTSVANLTQQRAIALAKLKSVGALEKPKKQK
jgi:hypothetical protein